MDYNSPHVQPGTYILQILSPEYIFEQVRRQKYTFSSPFMELKMLMTRQFRVDVLPDTDTPEVRPYFPGTPLNNPNSPPTYSVPYPLVLEAKRHLDFFVPKESFNVMGMLGSPMVLMMGFAALMALGLPYLMVSISSVARVPDSDTYTEKSGSRDYEGNHGSTSKDG